MKFLSIFILVSLLQLNAKAYSQQVSLFFKNVGLQEIFTEINTQTGRQFFYNDAMLAKAGKISINVKNVSLNEALALCFNNTPLTFSIVDNTIVVKEKTAIAAAAPQQPEQDMILTGKVTDTLGSPLEGAIVVVKETKKSVLTDIAGNFKTTAKIGQTLIFTFIGFAETQLKVTNNSSIKITMKPISSLLKSVELVNTGYQRLPKERSAGSFSTISNDDIKNKTFSMNVVDRLEGLVPGIAVNYGAGNEKFLIRGLSSIQGARSPLIVIDGVPITDFNLVKTLVNPEDVETMSVLRDATAASIWGSAAANGVIVITTKRGKTSAVPQKMRVKYSGFVSFRGTPDLDYFNMMNTSSFLDASRKVFSNTNYPWANVINSIGATPIVPSHERIQYDLARGLISSATANSRFDSLNQYNNRDQINQYFTQPSFLTNHSLSFDGGSNAYSYYGSIAYTADNSDNKTDLSRYQMNLRQVLTISPAIKLDLITNLSYEKTKKFLLPGLPFSNSNYLPYAMFADQSGNPLSQAYLKRLEEFRASSESLSNINLDYVPLSEEAKTSNDQSSLSARINAGLTIKLLAGLTYEGRAQFQQTGVDSYENYNKDSYRVRDELVYFTRASTVIGGAPSYFLPSKGGHYLTNNNNSNSWTIRNQLNFDKVFAQKHQLNVIGGAELRNDLSKSVQTFRRGYDFQTLTYSLYNEDSLAIVGVVNPINFLPGRTTNNVLQSRPVTYTEVERRFLSAYSNAAYTFDRKYTINGSIRFDQSNLFGTNKSLQYKPIWSLGGAWNISRESFFKVDAINNLNLRLTYGLAGNAPSPGFAGPFDIVSASNVAFFSGLGTGYTILVPRNENIRWERTATTNLGIDFTILNNRLSGSIDVYSKKTTDLLGYQPVDPTSGWSYAYNNLGDIENKGFEFQINSQNVSTKNFKWTTTFNISYNQNTITNLKRASPLTTSTKANASFVEGYAAYSLFAYDYRGLNSRGNPYSFKTNKTDTANRLADVTPDDLLFMGSTQPLWFGGITNTFTYKNFSLSFLIVYNLYQMEL